MIETNDNEAPKDDNAELVARLRKWESLSREKHSGWKKNAKEEYAFVAGDQWSQEDKAAVTETMCQPITFNRAGPMIDAVTGAEVLNRQAVAFHPREIGDAKVSEMMTGAADYVRDNCDAEDHESDAFADLVTCGMAWTETFVDYEDSPEGDIKIPRLDPLEMGWDPASKERNIADSRFRFRVRSFDKDTFKAKYGQELFDRVLAAQDDSTGDEIETNTDVAHDEYRNAEGTTGGARNRITVTQMQWYDLEDGFAVENPQTGSVEAIEPAKYQALVQMSLAQGAMPPSAAKHKRKVFYQALYSGDVLIEKKPLACSAFTLKCMTGKRDRNKNTWYGLVRAMRDPQMWANKWLSQLLHIINSNAKGGLVFETGAFVNQAKAEQEWAKPNSMVELQPGAIAGQRILPKQPANIPTGLKDLMGFAVESLPQVTGINLEMLGLVQREQAGVLEQQRKRSGYAILAVFFDALRKYRKEQGRVLMDYIQRYISDGRLVRIKGQGGQEYVPLLRQPGAAKYDVVVDEAPMSANQKDMVWSMLMQMMPMLKDAPIPMDVWAKILEYSPLPSSLTSEISQALTAPPQPDPMQQLELADKEAEVEQKKSTAALNYAKAGEAGMPQPQGPGGPTPIDAVAAQGTLQKDQSTAMLNIAKAKKTEVETLLLPIQSAQKAKADEMRARQPSPVASASR